MAPAGSIRAPPGTCSSFFFYFHIFSYSSVAETTTQAQIHEIKENWKPSFLTNDEFMHLMLEVGCLINTHYYNSNLIWWTVLLRVEELTSQDHTRRFTSSVIQ